MPPRFNKLLVLDLDETLIYATMFSLDRDCDFQVGLSRAYKRPGVDQFLTNCLKWFRVGIWTSATMPYAEDVISHLFSDPSRLAFVWAREHCSKVFDEEKQEWFWFKNAEELVAQGYERESILIVDDTPESWRGFAGNVIPVLKYKGDPADSVFPALLTILETVAS